MQAGYPRGIHTLGFPSTVRKIDAAFSDKEKKKTYFFAEDKYWRYYLFVITLYDPAAAKSLQWHPTLCDPIDGSPPGSPVPGILQARTPE